MYTSPRTWVASEVVTAALLNTHLRDNLLHLGGVGGAQWSNWTPTITQNGSGVAISIDEAKYVVIGYVCHVYARIAISGAGAAGGIRIGGQPSAMQPAADGQYVLGVGLVLDSGTGWYHGALLRETATDWRMMQDGSAGGVVGDAPYFALAIGDYIIIQGSYRVA